MSTSDRQKPGVDGGPVEDRQDQQDQQAPWWRAYQNAVDEGLEFYTDPQSGVPGLH